jgi:hypothetical protein
MAEEYKFPDEQDSKAPDTNDEFSIEVVDDTPEQDKGRKPLPKDIVEELDKDDLEEYSDKVKKRLSQMKKVWHDERRAKEEATREREEAIRFANAQVEENKKLRQRVGSGEKLFVQEITKAANSEVEAAKAKLKQAYESGDVDLITAAQDSLTDAKLKVREYERYKPSLQEQESPVQTTPEQTRQTNQVDPKALAWQKENTWFGTDEEMTALALGLHEKVVKSGLDPRSDEYYDRINSTMRKRFPEYFGEEKSAPQETERPTPRKPANVVAPATRSTAPRQVRLTASQVALAKKLGLTPEAYARELIKLENDNG